MRMVRPLIPCPSRHVVRDEYHRTFDLWYELRSLAVAAVSCQWAAELEKIFHLQEPVVILLIYKGLSIYLQYNNELTTFFSNE